MEKLDPTMQGIVLFVVIFALIGGVAAVIHFIEISWLNRKYSKVSDRTLYIERLLGIEPEEEQ
jgi:hypothetical protein